MQITVRSANPRRARLAQESLAASGLDVTACVGLPGSAPLHEDVAILYLEAGDEDWSQKTAAVLRACDRPPGVIVALSPLLQPPVEGDFYDAWVQGDSAPGLLHRDLRDIYRAAIAREELEARRETAQALCVDAAATPALPNVRCLYIGEPHPFYLALTHGLQTMGGAVDAAFSSFLGFDQLHDAPFDAAIVNAGGDPTLALMLCGAMRRNKRLNRMPTIVVGVGAEHAVQAAERGAALVLDDASAAEIAMAWVSDKIRRARWGRQTELALAALAPSDGASFLQRHIQTLAERAHLRGNALCVAALQVSLAPGAQATQPVDWTRGVQETCDVARRLVRSYDFVCLLPDDVIVIAFPATQRKEALRAVERVAAVAECTAFAAGERDAGPIVLARHVVELAPGESGARLLARALDFNDRVGVTA